MAAKKVKRNPKPKSEDSPSFESSLEKLKAIVAQLEAGNLPLSESLDKYELGIASLKSCYEALNQAQRRIETLVELDEDGNLVTQPFDDTASVEITEGSRRTTRRRTSADAIEDEDDLGDDSESLF